jgi:hypothetical protein
LSASVTGVFGWIAGEANIEHITLVVRRLFDVCRSVVTGDACSDAAVYPLLSIIV